MVEAQNRAGKPIDSGQARLEALGYKQTLKRDLSYVPIKLLRGPLSIAEIVISQTLLNQLPRQYKRPFPLKSS
jgi:hypothetical protein